MTTGHELKAAGMSRTLGNPKNAAFRAAYPPFAEAFIKALRIGATFQMEDIKAAYLHRGLPTPTPPAWGGCASGILTRMIHEGYIRHAGSAPSAQPGNHAHRYSFYERV